MRKLSKPASNGIHIPCHHCHGSGEIELSPHLKATLDAVKRHKTLTAVQAVWATGATHLPTAMNNRLEDLRKLGLVTREKTGKGRTFAYRATTNTKHEHRN